MWIGSPWLGHYPPIFHSPRLGGWKPSVTPPSSWSGLHDKVLMSSLVWGAFVWTYQISPDVCMKAIMYDSCAKHRLKKSCPLVAHDPAPQDIPVLSNSVNGSGFFSLKQKAGARLAVRADVSILLQQVCWSSAKSLNVEWELEVYCSEGAVTLQDP